MSDENIPSVSVITSTSVSISTSATTSVSSSVTYTGGGSGGNNDDEEKDTTCKMTYINWLEISGIVVFSIACIVMIVLISLKIKRNKMFSQPTGILSQQGMYSQPTMFSQPRMFSQSTNTPGMFAQTTGIW